MPYFNFSPFHKPLWLFEPVAFLGSERRDIAIGRFGDDRIDTGGGNDLILAGRGDDEVTAGADDGRLVVALEIDLTEIFDGLDLSIGLEDGTIAEETLAEFGDHAILAGKGEASNPIPCFFSGEPRALPDGDLMLTFLIETPAELVGLLEPCFLRIYTPDLGRIEIALDGPMTEAQSFGVAVNWGPNLQGEAQVEYVYEIDGVVETFSGVVDIPADQQPAETTPVMDALEIGDRIFGGPGADLFHFDPATDGVDRIQDFDLAEDRIAPAGYPEPCFLPVEGGTMVLFETEPGEFVDNAGIFLAGVDAEDLTPDIFL